MLQELKFKGLKVSDRSQFDLDLKVWKLKELCPCDAAVDVTVERQFFAYFMTISIHHQEIELTASAHGADLNKLSRDCFNKIHYALRNWKKGRFLTNSDDSLMGADMHMKSI